MEDKLEQFKWLIGKIPFVQRSGIEFTDITEEGVGIKIPLNGNQNHLGTVYAGAQFTMAEFIGVPALINHLGYDGTMMYTLKEMNIRYRRPATTDLTTFAHFTKDDAKKYKAIYDAEGKADILIEMELKDATGEVVALTKNLYHIRQMPKK